MAIEDVTDVFDMSKQFHQSVELFSVPFNGEAHFFSGGQDDQVVVVPDPTSTNIISGNVKKLDLPYEVKVVAVSVELEQQVLGYTTSDPTTGDYSIDVYPWTGEVLVFTSPDYGLSFSPLAAVAVGQIIHPTIPNKNVYEVTVAGQLSDTEPNWGESVLNNGGVTLIPVPLYRPLINGFIKPTITPV